MQYDFISKFKWFCFEIHTCSMCEAPLHFLDFSCENFWFFSCDFVGFPSPPRFETSAGDLGRVGGSRNTVARMNGTAGVVVVMQS